MPSNGSQFLRGMREHIGFRWTICAILLVFTGCILAPGFIFGSVMSAHELRDMNSTHAIVLETNVPPPASMDAMTPAARHRWERNATLVTFTAGGAERSAMVSTLPSSMQGASVLIWYNATTFGNVLLDDDRGFQPNINMLIVGVLTLAIGIWMIRYDRKLKRGHLKPVTRTGLGGGRHQGRF